MNKNGFLLAEETLKIIIAFIALTFLVYFLTSLYFAKVNEVDFGKAKQILIDSPESLANTFQNLIEGKTRQFILQDPVGWHLFSFIGNDKPNSCSGKNCLCICNTPLSTYFTPQIEECDKKNSGVCTVVTSLESNVDIKILKDLKTTIFIKKVNDKISIVG